MQQKIFNVCDFVCKAECLQAKKAYIKEQKALGKNVSSSNMGRQLIITGGIGTGQIQKETWTQSWIVSSW